MLAVMIIRASEQEGGPQVVAPCWLRHRGLLQMQDERAAECVEQLIQEGCIRCSFFFVMRDLSPTKFSKSGEGPAIIPSLTSSQV